MEHFLYIKYFFKITCITHIYSSDCGIMIASLLLCGE